MHCQQISLVGLVLCLATVFIQSTSSYPLNQYDDTDLTEKDKQDILHSAARIIRIVMGGESHQIGGVSSSHKRSTLDAVMDMPHLLNIGRK
jgi:hypothetical protein